MIIVNNNSSDFKYNEHIIISCNDFNIYGGVILFFGIISCFLSISPRTSKLLFCCNASPNEENMDVVDSIKNDEFGYCFKGLFVFLVICLVSAPVIIVPFLISPQDHAYVFYHAAKNETRTFKISIGKDFGSRDLKGNLNAFILAQQRAMDGDKPSKDTLPMITGRFPSKHDIISISKDNLPLRIDEINHSKPMAVLIVDTEEYRPSSSLQNFGLNYSIPVLIVRRENGPSFLEDNPGYVELKITHDFSRVELPEWRCDSNLRCLPPIFNDGYINGK